MRVKITKKPWGEEHLFALSGKYAGKIMIVREGHRLSLQYHKKKEETFYLLEGLMKITIGTLSGKSCSRTVRPGGIVHLPPNTVHRTEALKNCRIIEVSTPELDDIVRLKDDYNRIVKKIALKKR